MPSYHGQTVDVFNDFEQLPGAGWVLTDPASAMSVSPSAKFEGANGMLFNPTSLTPAWDGYDIGSDVNVVRFGFWYNVPTQTQNAGFVLVFVAQDTALNNTCRVYIGDDGATGLYSVAVSNSANDLHKLTGIAPGSWYWITGRIANNGNTVLSVYNAAGGILGTISEVTGTLKTRYLTLGPQSAFTMTSNAAFDSFVADFSSGSVVPLLGWDVPVVFIPQTVTNTPQAPLVSAVVSSPVVIPPLPLAGNPPNIVIVAPAPTKISGFTFDTDGLTDTVTIYHGEVRNGTKLFSVQVNGKMTIPHYMRIEPGATLYAGGVTGKTTVVVNT